MTETSSIASTESNIVNSYKYGSVGKPLVNNKAGIYLVTIPFMSSDFHSENYGEFLRIMENLLFP